MSNLKNFAYFNQSMAAEFPGASGRLAGVLRGALALNLLFLSCLSPGRAEEPIAGDDTPASSNVGDQADLNFLMSSFAVSLLSKKGVDSTLTICLQGTSQKAKATGASICGSFYPGILAMEILSLDEFKQKHQDEATVEAIVRLIAVHEECTKYVELIGKVIKLPETEARLFIGNEFSEYADRLARKQTEFVNAVESGWALDDSAKFRLKFLNM